MTAFPTTSDAVRNEARREGAGGGSSCPRAEPRRREEWTRPDLSMAASVDYLWSVEGRPSLPTKLTENGISTVYEAFYTCEFPATSEPLLSPYSALIQPLANC